MYRFRTIKNLLDGNNELENQEIYFAPPEELNDPMEGYQDIFWKGDKIIWRNFITNYTRSLENAFGLAFLLNGKERITDKDIVVLSQLHGLQGLNNKKLIQQIIDRIFSYGFISNLSNDLSERTNPIRRDELLSYLEFIHLFALSSISDVYMENKLITMPFFNRNLKTFSGLLKKSGNIVDLVNKIESETRSSKNTSDNFFSITNMHSQQMKLIKMYNLTEKDINSSTFFLISDFPEKYLLRLEASIYPDWYCASFLDNCNNSSIWGHYGDNHRGVCLKFKVNEIDGIPSLNLIKEYGYNTGPIIAPRPLAFNKIIYSSKHVEIDFFRSIARMPKMTINALWYLDENENVSIYGDHLNKDEDTWRESYWNNFNKSVTAKLDEWKYEQEHRLIIHGDLIDYKKKENRKLKYEFNDLESVIFGIKTTPSDKIKILKIIENKCKQNNRKEFDFQQAYYSKDTGKIETFKLNLLKFN